MTFSSFIYMEITINWQNCHVIIFKIVKYTHSFSLQPFMVISHLKIFNIFWVLTPNVFYNPFHFKPQNKPKQKPEVHAQNDTDKVVKYSD